MTYRPGLFCVLYFVTAACSGERDRAPALNPNVDSGFADRNVVEDANDEDTASSDAIDLDSMPADVAGETADAPDAQLGTDGGDATSTPDVLPETTTDAP
jgi:hypothetical protein